MGSEIYGNKCIKLKQFFFEKGESSLCHKLLMHFDRPSFFSMLITLRNTDKKIRDIKNVEHRIKGLGGS